MGLTRSQEGVQKGDADRRQALLTITIVGGGPAGVEMAGTLGRLARLVESRDTESLAEIMARTRTWKEGT